MNVIYTESLSLPLYNRAEILRYCGSKGSTEELDALIKECQEEIEGKIKALVCYTQFPVQKTEEGLDLGFTLTNSKLIKKHLKDCGELILFAATIGTEIDRLITKYSRISPTKALIFQSIGAERIEALCDTFEEKIKAQYTAIPRISAGYGDIPLAMQRDIFSVLDCSKKIGLTLTGSLLMSPTKSVTGIIGVKL